MDDTENTTDVILKDDDTIDVVNVRAVRQFVLRKIQGGSHLKSSYRRLIGCVQHVEEGTQTLKCLQNQTEQTQPPMSLSPPLLRKTDQIHMGTILLSHLFDTYLSNLAYSRQDKM